MGSTPVAEASMGIMNVFRSINTDAYHNFIAPKAITPNVEARSARIRIALWSCSTPQIPAKDVLLRCVKQVCSIRTIPIPLRIHIEVSGLLMSIVQDRSPLGPGSGVDA
jgi:hypothetical protein